MQEIFQIMPKILPIMLFSPYYAKNYAGIIDTGLQMIQLRAKHIHEIKINFNHVFICTFYKSCGNIII